MLTSLKISALSFWACSLTSSEFIAHLNNFEVNWISSWKDKPGDHRQPQIKWSMGRGNVRYVHVSLAKNYSSEIHLDMFWQSFLATSRRSAEGRKRSSTQLSVSQRVQLLSSPTLCKTRIQKNIWLCKRTMAVASYLFPPQWKFTGKRIN